MATVKPRNVDLPQSFSRANGNFPAEYPEGEARTEEKTLQYARYTRALWDEQEEKMATLHRIWTRCLIFLSGRQWWVPGRNPRSPFAPPKVPSWKELPVTNLTMAFFRTYLAKVLKNRPAWLVVPASTEPDDIHSAELADQALESKWQELRLGRVLRSAVSWCITTGNGFLYPFWNSTSGKMTVAETLLEVPTYGDFGEVTGSEEVTVLLDKNGDPQLGEDGRPDPAAKEHFIDEGEVGLRSISPFQVRVNPEAESEEDLQWVIIGEAVSLRELAISHPKLIGKIRPENVDNLEHDRATAAIGTLMGDPGTTLTPPGDRRDEDLQRALRLHYHEKPCEKYPGGRYWQTVGDVLLEEPQDLPEGIWPPIIHLKDIDVPGQFFGTSVLEQIIPINKSYNEINATIREHHNLMAKGKWLAPRGSGVQPGSITNAPGEVIQFNLGFEPKQARIEPLPQTIVEERNRVFSDFEIVSGIHRVSMGKAPPGVSAGVAFLQLQEADDTDLGPFLTMLEESVAEAAGAILRIIQTRYTTERLIYVAGSNQRYQVRAFKGSDLKGARDVKPQAGSSFPWSRTAQQSMMLTLAAQMPQLFTNPETGQFDTAKFARLLPVGGFSAISQETDLDVQEALREEELFSLIGTEEGGDVPQVGFWQNHEIHYLQHVRVLKSAAFKDWPTQGQQAFLQHVQQTMQQRDQKAVQNAQMNAMAQGNAPKELYQQGGPVPGGQASPTLNEDMISQMSPDEIAALEGLESPPWLDERMALYPPAPAAGDL